MNTNKDKLIKDIQDLLNSYDGLAPTTINPNLLTFMDEETLKQIIGSLLDEKDKLKDEDKEWLEKFKTK